MGRRLAFTLLILAAAASPAAEPFQRLDASGNGKLDRLELVGAGLFQRSDGNGDGRLSAEEFRGPPSLYWEWDADGDFRLSEDEFYWALFRYADRDADGGVAAEEYLRLERTLRRSSR